ncbi:MAG: OmpA family protein [Bacteroidia bacterium]|nr:OmpA family protein [Bacteroidia bacterium]
MRQYLRIPLLLLLFLAFTDCSAQKRGGDDNMPSKHESQGLRYYQMGEYNKALEQFKAGLKKEPESKSLLNMVSAIYQELNDHESAIPYLKQLTQFHPDYANGYLFLAQSQYMMMQYKEAKLSLDTFYKGKDLRPDNVKQADKMSKSITFAINAKDHPLDITFENLGSNINSKHLEYWPGFTIDESVFIFTRQDSYGEDIYMSRKSGEEWGKAFPLPGDVNTPNNEGNVSITADGKYIFYTACNRPDGYGGCDIYLSIMNPDGTFSKPRIVRPPLNSGAWESQPCISPDGMTIYFASNREGGYGGIDIWKAEWKGSNFGNPVNLGPEINTDGDDQAPFIHPDGKTLYFSSNGRDETMGGPDLYISRFDGKKWSKPENMGYPINTSGEEFGMIVDRMGEYAYVSSDRKGGYGGRDLYRFKLPKDKKPEPVSYVKGKVYDKITRKPLAATVELIDLKTGNSIKTVTTDSIAGEFLIVLSKNQDYMFNIDRKDYLFYSDNFRLTEGTIDKPFLVEAPLVKPEKGSTIVLHNIFFDTDKFILKPESKAELQKLFELMNRFPDMIIEIGGHTDNTGNKEHNKKLSENRAKAVLEYLVEMGIRRNRLTAMGYADEVPMMSNETEAGRAQNRRTEIKIISNN